MNTMTMNAPALTGNNPALTAGTRSFQETARHSQSALMRLMLSLATVVPGIAFAVGTFSLFHVAGTHDPLGALAGSAVLVYLGTAFLSARPGLAVFDISTGIAALWLVTTTGSPHSIAAAFIVHALWGILRGAIGVNESPQLLSNWTAFSSAMALLLLIG
ncbi:MAG: hypothetical protein WBO47_06560 [Gammaproteobacteria bacterium]